MLFEYFTALPTWLPKAVFVYTNDRHSVMIADISFHCYALEVSSHRRNNYNDALLYSDRCWKVCLCFSRLLFVLCFGMHSSNSCLNHDYNRDLNCIIIWKLLWQIQFLSAIWRLYNCTHPTALTNACNGVKLLAELMWQKCVNESFHDVYKPTFSYIINLIPAVAELAFERQLHHGKTRKIVADEVENCGIVPKVWKCDSNNVVRGRTEKL